MIVDPISSMSILAGLASLIAAVFSLVNSWFRKATKEDDPHTMKITITDSSGRAATHKISVESMRLLEQLIEIQKQNMSEKADQNKEGGDFDHLFK